MASRRVRIKGIANIPQRKKTENKPDIPKENSERESVVSSQSVTPKEISNLEPVKNEETTEKVTDCNNVEKSQEESIQNQNLDAEACERPSETTKEQIKPRRSIIKPVIKTSRLIRKQDHSKAEESKNNISDNKINHVTETTTSIPESENKQSERSEIVLTLPEKEFSSCSNVDEEKNNSDISHHHEEGNSEENFVKPKNDINLVSHKGKINTIRKDESDPDMEIELTGEKVNTTTQKEDEGRKSPQTGVKPVHSSLSESAKSNSDIEYPLPPSSPNKILSRSRIKAIPCLNHRRISFSVHGSASESEDENRRNFKRIRNDSVSSTVSCANEAQTKTESANSPVKIRDISQVNPKKKFRRTEHSRRMAEARREFNLKFGKGIPDRQKLTMLDLIFYNPVSNPMSQKKKKKQNDDKDVNGDINSINTSEETTSKDTEKYNGNKDKSTGENEDVDDPDPKSDEEEDVLAPQIKIGPNGEIVIDEQSLVIENKETKKNRETLQNSEIIDGDFDTGFNGYKRAKRAKEWTTSETIRFFKALNTIGTDFSIMAELFPDRTRRDLKMKFKKEEKVNQVLVDKALTQPIQFDMTDLRRDLEREQHEKQEYLKRYKELLEAKEKAKMQPKRTKKGGIVAKNLDPESVPPKKRRKKTVKKSEYTRIVKGIAGILESDSEDSTTAKKGRQKTDHSSSDESDSDASLNLETQVPPILFPTRSGRIPKPSKRLTYPETDSKEIVRHEPNKNSIDPSQINPGTIMIVSSETPSGAPVYRVFMLTNNQNVTTSSSAPPPNTCPSAVANSAEGLVAENILTVSAEVNATTENNISCWNGSNIADLPAIVFSEKDCLQVPIENNITIAHVNETEENLEIPHGKEAEGSLAVANLEETGENLIVTHGRKSSEEESTTNISNLGETRENIQHSNHLVETEISSLNAENKLAEQIDIVTEQMEKAENMTNVLEEANNTNGIESDNGKGDESDRGDTERNDKITCEEIPLSATIDRTLENECESQYPAR